jgi:hypothetical protein
MLSSHLRPGLPSDFFPSVSPTKTQYTPRFVVLIARNPQIHRDGKFISPVMLMPVASLRNTASWRVTTGKCHF